MLTFLHYRLLVKHALVSCIFLRHAMPFFSFAIEHQQSAYSDTRCATSRQPSIRHANTLFHSTQLLLLPRYPMCHLKITQYLSCVPQHATAVATAVSYVPLQNNPVSVMPTLRSAARNCCCYRGQGLSCM